jgi:hypothetical protein
MQRRDTLILPELFTNLLVTSTSAKGSVVAQNSPIDNVVNTKSNLRFLFKVGTCMTD